MQNTFCQSGKDSKCISNNFFVKKSKLHLFFYPFPKFKMAFFMKCFILFSSMHALMILSQSTNNNSYSTAGQRG